MLVTYFKRLTSTSTTLLYPSLSSSSLLSLSLPSSSSSSLSSSFLLSSSLSSSLIIKRYLALELPNRKFLSSEFIEAAIVKLIKNKEVTSYKLTEFLNVYKTEMKMNNFIFFLNKVNKRKLLTPYHIYIVSCGIKFINNGETLLNLNDFNILFENLKYMNAKRGGVRCLVSVITEKLILNDELLSSKQVGNYLLAFRNMRSGHGEIRELIQLLSKKIQLMNEPLDLSDFSRGFHGIQKLSSRYPEIRSLLKELTIKLNSNNSKFTSEQLFELLPGFQRLENDSDEVKNITTAVLNHTNFETISNVGLIENQVNLLKNLQRLESNNIQLNNLLNSITTTPN